jgi:hypothetical protein
MSFVVTIERSATYRLVPEDPRHGGGINVPYRLEDMTGRTASGRVDLPLRAEGVATYVEGSLREIVVPDGWRVEQWPEGGEADDEVVRRFLADLD